MLLNSRPAPAEMRHFGRLEVTFAYDPPTTTRPDSGRLFAPQTVARSSDFALQNATAAQGSALPGAARYPRSELDELRQQIAALRAEVGKSALVNATPTFDDFLFASGAALEEQGILMTRLAENGMEMATARDLAAATARKPGERRAVLSEELAARVPVRTFSPMNPGECRTLAFVGPAGRGKSTSLVKVACRYGLARRIPVKIYSAGAHGVGGQEQMARYAALLGVPFHACESLESLQLTLTGEARKGLILIDTPGIAPSEEEEMGALANFLGRIQEVETHLVLRADARTADMVRTVARFSAVGPSCLLFTGLDEAVAPGAMLETLIRSGIPAMFAGTGSGIPDDLEEVSAAKLAQDASGIMSLAAAAA